MGDTSLSFGLPVVAVKQKDISIRITVLQIQPIKVFNCLFPTVAFYCLYIWKGH